MKAAIVFIAAAVLLIAFSCSNEGGGFFAKLLKGGSAVPVTVESVVLKEREQELSTPASLEASDSSDVTLTEDAVIERVVVAEGDAVAAGDALLRISEQALASELARLRADAKEAQATLEKNRYLLKNRDRLLDEGKLDRSQYDALDADVQAGEAAAERLQQQVARIEERAGNPVITSPISGVVGRVSAQAGSSAPAGKAVMTITRSDPVIASFRLPSQNATAVRSGMAVKVRLPELGIEGAGRVTAVGAELDPRDNTFLVKASLPNPEGRFKIGMRAEAAFASSEKQRFFLIPEEALIKERQAYFVFTVNKGVAHRVQVIPSETRGSRVEITRGLAEADLVVVKGHDKLSEGAIVDIWGR